MAKKVQSQEKWKHVSPKTCAVFTVALFMVAPNCEQSSINRMGKKPCAVFTGWNNAQPSKAMNH